MKTIIDLINNFENRSKKIFLIQKDTTVSYGELSDAVLRAIYLLQQHGFKKDEKVILSIIDDVDIIVFFLACLRSGIAPILIDSTTKETRVNAVIKSANPSGFIIDAIQKEAWQLNENDNCILIKRSENKKGKLFQKLFNKPVEDDSSNIFYPKNVQHINTSAVVLPENIDPSTIAYVIYTSGTSSDQKGVVISHKNLFTHLQTLSNVYQMNDQSVILNILSLYHTDGIMQGPVLTLFNEATLCRKEKFEVNTINDLLSCIYKYNVSHFFVVPTMLSIINKYSADYEDSFQTEYFKYILSSAAALEIQLWKEFENKFDTKIINVYGLSETVAGGLFCIPGTTNYKIGTIGKPIDCEAKIINEQGNECAINESGELILKGDNIFCGYLNNAAATNEAIKNNWFYTGDIAQKDADGVYKITGRKKNMIKAGGFSIHPEEITEILQHHPSIFEAWTIGHTDSVYGEIIISFIVPKEDEKIETHELTEYCSTNLEPEKIPAKFIFLDEIPKTHSGKTDVQKLITFVSTSKISINNQRELENNIKLLAAEVFRTNPDLLTLKSNAFNVSGWDSFSIMNLITNIEEAYSVNFKTSEIMSIKKIEDIIKILEKKLK